MTTSRILRAGFLLVLATAVPAVLAQNAHPESSPRSTVTMTVTVPLVGDTSGNPSAVSPRIVEVTTVGASTVFVTDGDPAPSESTLFVAPDVGNTTLTMTPVANFTSVLLTNGPANATLSAVSTASIETSSPDQTANQSADGPQDGAEPTSTAKENAAAVEKYVTVFQCCFSPHLHLCSLHAPFLLPQR